VIATGIVHYLGEHNVKIPREMALVTFDNVEWTQIVSPAVTVIAQPAYEMGANAADLILKRIQSPEKAPVQTALQTTLIKRNST
jgi:LacI family transcriptional regulator